LYFQIPDVREIALGGDEYITSLAFWNVRKWPPPHPAKQADFWRDCVAQAMQVGPPAPHHKAWHRLNSELAPNVPEGFADAPLSSPITSMQLVRVSNRRRKVV
jgi:hypothetical protein